MGWTRHRVENSSAVVMFMAKNPYRKLGKEKGEEYPRGTETGSSFLL